MFVRVRRSLILLLPHRSNAEVLVNVVAISAMIISWSNCAMAKSMLLSTPASEMAYDQSAYLRPSLHLRAPRCESKEKREGRMEEGGEGREQRADHERGEKREKEAGMRREGGSSSLPHPPRWRRSVEPSVPCLPEVLGLRGELKAALRIRIGAVRGCS